MQIKGVSDTNWNQAPDVKPFFYTDGKDYTETAVAISAANKTIFVVFRGTDLHQVADLLVDILVVRGPYGPINGSALLPGAVDEGFNLQLFDVNLYIPLTDAVRSAINKNPNYKVVVTGLSSGAAMSTLYGAYLASKIVPSNYNIRVFNVASPRICNDVFKSALRNLSNLAIWKLAYEEDIVPRLPPETLGYRHPGHLIYWNGKNNVKAYFQTEGDPSKGYTGVDFGIGGTLADHEMAKYKSALTLSISDPADYWPVAFETIPTPAPISSPTAAPMPRKCCLHIIICLFYC